MHREFFDINLPYNVSDAILPFGLWFVSLMWLYFSAQRKLKLGLFYLMIELIFSATAFLIHFSAITRIWLYSDVGLVWGCGIPVLIILSPYLFFLWELKSLAMVDQSGNKDAKKKSNLKPLGPFVEYYQLSEKGMENDKDNPDYMTWLF
jgi:hypothetical protein